MRLRESFALDAIIDERRKSLSRDDLDREELDKRSKVLAVLIECRERIDEITKTVKAPEIVSRVTNIGDINVDLKGGGAAGSKIPYQPFDGGDLIAGIKRELQKAGS